MAKLTQAQIKENAKVQALSHLTEIFNEVEAVQFADYKFAILTEVEGQEVWVEVALTSKQYTNTKVANAFDPYEASQDWQLEKEAKEKEAEAKAKIKADKIGKSKSKTKAKSEEVVTEE